MKFCVGDTKHIANKRNINRQGDVCESYASENSMEKCDVPALAVLVISSVSLLL